VQEEEFTTIRVSKGEYGVRAQIESLKPKRPEGRKKESCNDALKRFLSAEAIFEVDIVSVGGKMYAYGDPEIIIKVGDEQAHYYKFDKAGMNQIAEPQVQ